MIVDVVMPKMGESITEGTIIEWKVDIGDIIKQDEPLLEISTDKVESEIPSPASGIVKEILCEPNSTVEVGAVIARIDTEVEVAGATTPEAEEPRAEEVPALIVKPKPTSKEEAASTLPEMKPTDGEPTRRFYSPLVHAIAREEGLSREELDSIVGTGREGRVTKADLMAYLVGRKQAAQPAAPPQFAAPGGENLADEVLPMSRIRQRIAERMRQSLDTSAHVYAVAECDMTSVVDAHARKAEDFHQRERFKLTYTPMIAFATIKAIRDFPLINARVDGSNIVKKRSINLGIAVALPDYSLIVPVVHQAEEFNFLGLARKIADLAERARASQLKPEEAAGSTFSITNFGVFGSVFGLPIINQPNVAILGVGAIRKRPVVWESEMGDSIVIRSIMLVSLGHDHRLIDGAYGTQFLQRTVHYLQTIDWDKEL
ncbi:MAG: dihydrolipoamide acetyltransferase family protein [Candidatus Neomarinimicrobiota bacterium]